MIALNSREHETSGAVEKFAVTIHITRSSATTDKFLTHRCWKPHADKRNSSLTDLTVLTMEGIRLTWLFGIFRRHEFERTNDAIGQASQSCVT